MKSIVFCTVILISGLLVAQTTTTTIPVSNDIRPQNKSNYETKIYDSSTSFSTSSKVVIDKEEIQNSKAPNMSALLSTKANINITNTAFQPNAVFVRGGDSSQVLILIDDIPVYDASTIQRAFNLNSVNLNSVEKITIVKGSQSVWYGGQALSAVIKIDTLPRQWTNKNRVESQLGSDSFRDMNADVQQAISDTSLATIRGQYQFQNSSSPVPGSEFKYKKRKDNLDAVYYYRDDFHFNAKLSHFSDRNENVTGVSFRDFAAADTLEFVTSTEVNQFQTSYKNNSSFLKPLLSVGYVDSHRVFSHNVNSFNSVEENQEYKSYLIPVRGEVRLVNSETIKWDMGASFQKEGMLYESFKRQIANNSNEMIGTFTKLEYYANADTTYQAGYRYDTDLNFKDVNTYQVGMTNKDFKLEHSTGYRLPSLYQLYSNKGNSGLNPESSRTYSVSYDTAWSESIETSATAFETHIENLIAARGNPMQYYNVGRTITKGLEGSIFYRYSTDQKWTLNVGYQEPRDINTGRWLARRPLKSASIVYSQTQDRATWNLEMVGRGERDDVKNTTQTVRLNGYSVLNTSYIYRLSPSMARSLALNDISLHFRGQNLLSEKYQESYGYFSPGLEFYAGLRAEL